MAHLSLSLLGPFQMTLDGQPVTGFKSSKVRALLAYLAVEVEQPHRRSVLAALLWSDWPDREALSNLRYALSNLRKVIGDRDAEPPFLLITRDTLQFNTNSDYCLDVAAFGELMAVDESDPSAIDQLEQAVALHRGSFLEGFSVDDSPAFEEWAFFTRQQVERQMSSALHRLASTYEQRGDYDQAQACAWRQLALEPWDEIAHRQLMRALALSRQRSAALAQYETCRRLLAEELGVEPGKETTRLYQRIRDGSLGRRRGEQRGSGSVAAARAISPEMPATELPSFLHDEGVEEVERSVFVARERELGQLNAFLERALTGEGGVVFITGEGGSGKTALAQAFTRRAQERHADLLVAAGSCHAYTGVGDPYLPFRQILGLLTGDVEARWAAGAITRDHARRLWAVLPLSAQALVEHGPDLIDAFIPRAGLLRRVRACASGRAAWLNELDELLARKPSGPGVPSPQRVALFEQYTRLMLTLASRAPLVLVLDDLQWADAGSIDLLFHLGRQLAGSRILIVGIYRGEEVAIGREGERHPLEPVVNELRRALGDLTVDLGEAQGRSFMEALLDSEPNRLGDDFREMLYQQTLGHPLFTVELLRGLQERGDLVQDGEGRWVAGSTLDWETLPVRVEAVIAERIGRLEQPLRAALQVASVEGERFTAEAVARVRGTGEQDILRCLSRQLDRKHRLVRAESIRRIDGQTLSQYRFRHILFQKYLYGTLDPVERVHLHERVGMAMEGLYGAEESVTEAAVQLALHFQRAQLVEKAIHYLHKAGDKAVQVSAYPEAIGHLAQALSLLESLPDTRERAEKELALQVSLSMARMGGIPGPEWERAVIRARELSHQMGETFQFCRVLGAVSILHYVRAEHQKAYELADEALSLAQQADDPLLVALGHWYMGFISFALGEHMAARAHLERVISFYDPGQHHRSFLEIRGTDPGVSARAYHASCLWCLGYPERAVEQSQEALALARALNHPFTLADTVCFGGCVLHQMRQDASALKETAEELIRLSQGLLWSPSFLGTGTGYRGEALAELGRVEEGIEQMHEGVRISMSIGARCHLSGTLRALAKAQARAGRPEEGLDTLSRAFDFIEETDERCYEPELHRLEGNLLLMQDQQTEAEKSFDQAIETAHRQHARSWELRATVSLCRLWQEQGQTEQARQRLSDIYGWFTEGFETPDLKEAATLLQELSPGT